MEPFSGIGSAVGIVADPAAMLLSPLKVPNVVAAVRKSLNSGPVIRRVQPLLGICSYVSVYLKDIIF